MKVKIKTQEIFEKLGINISLFLQHGMAYNTERTSEYGFRAVNNSKLETTPLTFPFELEFEVDEEEKPVKSKKGYLYQMTKYSEEALILIASTFGTYGKKKLFRVSDSTKIMVPIADQEILFDIESSMDWMVDIYGMGQSEGSKYDMSSETQKR